MFAYAITTDSLAAIAGLLAVPLSVAELLPLSSATSDYNVPCQEANTSLHTHCFSAIVLRCCVCIVLMIERHIQGDACLEREMLVTFFKTYALDAPHLTFVHLKACARDDNFGFNGPVYSPVDKYGSAPCRCCF